MAPIGPTMRERDVFEDVAAFLRSRGRHAAAVYAVEAIYVTPEGETKTASILPSPAPARGGRLAITDHPGWSLRAGR
jgi:hypothetical protein